MNIATVLGALIGMGVLVFATVETTSSTRIFLNTSGMLIVLGGTTAATFICYPLKEVFRVFHVFLSALKREELPLERYIAEIQYLARQASAKGKLRLEREAEGIENAFLQEGLQMVADGLPPEQIRTGLETRIETTYARVMSEASIFRTMARLAPAFGIVGTLIGLVSMLQSMGTGNMEGLGPAMATAFIATLYGCVLANLVFYPIAVKVERRIEERTLAMHLIKEGLLLIAVRTPAELVVDKLRAFIPPRKWAGIRRRATQEADKPAAVKSAAA